MKPRLDSQFSGYGIAMVAALLATGFQFLLHPYLGNEASFIAYFPAVFATALFAGFGPTLLTVVLCSLAAGHWFLPPDDSLLPEDSSGWLRMVIFLGLGLGAAVLAEWMHRASTHFKQECGRLYTTLASIGDAVIITDTKGLTQFLNSAAEHLTGWTSAEACGKPLAEVFRIADEQTRQPIASPVERVLREGQIVGLGNHTLLMAKDGTERAIDDSAAPIRDGKCDILGVVLVFRDVTELRATQRASARLASLVDSSDEAILGQTFEGVITDWNAGAERLFGYQADEVIGRSIFTKIVPPDRKQELLQVLQRVRKGERVEQFESMRQDRHGRNFPVAIRISPIRNAKGIVFGASAIDRDISLQCAAESRRNARLAVTQILAQEQNVEKAIESILSAVCSALKWDVGCFWRLDKSQKHLSCHTFWSRPGRRLEAFRSVSQELTFEPGTSLPGRVWEQQQAIWNPDVVDDPKFVRAAQARQDDLHGGFACPVAVGDELHGIIEFFSHEIREPDEDLLEMMATIGGQIGQFIERRQAEAELRRSEHTLFDFFENAAIGLQWLGPDGRIQRGNKALLDLLGYTQEEFVGRHISEFHDDANLIEGILQRLTSGEQVRDCEARLRCKDGSVKHVLLDSNALWEDGRFVRTRCFTRDITERKRAEALLHDSEERLRLALEAGHMGTWEWHVPSGKVIWSTTLEAIHGLPPNSFPGTLEAYQSDMHPDDRERVLDSIRRTVDEGREHHLEYRIIWPDGTLHWLDARGRLFRDATGQPLRLIGVCSDVTQRKFLEQQLQQRLGELADAEARTRSVVDNVIDGILILDSEGLITSVNPAAEQIFDYSTAELLGKTIDFLIPDVTLGADSNFLGDSLSSSQAGPGSGREGTGRRKDGSTFPLDMAVSEFQFDHKRYFTALVRDVAARKRMEDSLRFLAEASKSLSSLADYKRTLQIVAQLAVPGFADWCAVDMLDNDGTLQRLAVSHVNPSKTRLAVELHRRFPPNSDAAHGVSQILRTGESQLVSQISPAVLEQVAVDEEHLRILRELSLNSYIGVPLRTKESILGVISFVFAESGRHYAADDLGVAEDLARRASNAIENARLYQEVREADRRKDEFLAMLAHELRNPLAPIRSGLDLLAMDAGTHEETVRLMQDQLEHVVRLVDDLLDVSRIMRGKVELRREVISLSALIKRSEEVIRPLVNEHGQELSISQSEEPLWLDVDPVRLVQVLENLLNNASKYTDRGGHIELKAQREGDTAVITVRDTGVGIEAELLPRVFDLFTQSTRSLDRAQGGLGIGLTLVQRLIEFHGGTVAVASAGAGQGSTFTVRLPIVATTEKVNSEASPSSMSSGPRRILIVDDNIGAARMLSLLLSKLEHPEVDAVHDGPTALQKIKSTHPEIVLLDIGLPGMDGYQVAKEVRRDTTLDDVLLVALTGYGQPEDRRRSKEAGFDVHLVKPPSLDQIREILNHPKVQSGG